MGWVVITTPRPLYPRSRPGTHCIGGWVGPRAGLDRCGKSPPTEIRSPDRPALSESLYRLSYPALTLFVHNRDHAIPLAGLGGYRKLSLPEFLDARHKEVVRLSGLSSGRLYPQEVLFALISGRGWVDPRVTVRPVIPQRIKASAFSLVPQCLN